MVKPPTLYLWFQDGNVGQVSQYSFVKWDRIVSTEDLAKTSVELSPFTPRLLPLKSVLEHVKLFSDSQVHELLLKYTGENVLGILKDVGDIDTRRLLALLLWISEDARFTVYGKPLVDVVIDAETRKFQFISIVLPECRASEWGKVVVEIKDEMEKAGLNDITSKVAIVCLRGLQELLR